MFERVVVGVAKIDRGREIARQVFDLARDVGAEVHLVMAVSARSGQDDTEAMRHAESFLESLAESTTVTTRGHAIPGDPVDALLRVASEVDADLVVVGNKGMKGAGRVLGSVPNAVAHKAPCSVLILDSA